MASPVYVESGKILNIGKSPNVFVNDNRVTRENDFPQILLAKRLSNKTFVNSKKVGIT